MVSKSMFLASILLLVFLIGCTTETGPVKVPTDKGYCEDDSDCICGGKDVDGSCFLGNRAYYDANVDKKQGCPDFCAGIAGNLKASCVNNKCTQTFECLTDEECDGTCVNNKCIETESACKSDKDCVTGGCSGTICRNREDEPVFTTCEYKMEYGCYKSDADCACANGRCGWDKGDGFDECVDKARGMI
ncbi:MAG: eight-cysteine-cluster domain-containing protein [Candidatus Nanoarchaeia archaeon]